MSRFFTDKPQDGQIIIVGEDAVHIKKSLRMQVGDEIFACDGDGQDYICKIAGIDKDEIALNVIEQMQNIAEASIDTTLFMAYPKGDKMDLICQKCTELGITRIVPFVAKRSVARPRDNGADKKIIRFNKICQEAAKQSGRGKVPEVLSVLTFEQAVQSAKEYDLAVMLYENEDKTSLKTILNENKFSSIAFMVGPEGGFDSSEVEIALENGFFSATLGKRILRCETAPIVALSAIMFHTDNI